MGPAGSAVRGRALILPLLLLLLGSHSEAAAPGEPEAADRRRGLELLASEDLPRAIEALSQAVSLAPDDAVALSALTVAYLRSANPEFAEFYFDQALGSERRKEVPAELWETIGDAWAAGNHTREALEAWTFAWMQGRHSETLRARIERGRRERLLESGQQYFRGEHFEFYFDPAISLEDVRRADSLLAQAERSESELFGVSLARPPVVVLYGGRKFVRVLDTPDWVAGFFDGRIHAPIFPLQSLDEEAAGLLRHELAHAYLAEISHGRTPAWLQEGLAQLVEGRHVTASELAASASAAPGEIGVPRDEDFRQRSDRDRARRAYVAALSFVQDLAADRGVRAVVCLADALGRGEPMDAAAIRELGARLSDLEERWCRRLKANARIPCSAAGLR